MIRLCIIAVVINGMHCGDIPSSSKPIEEVPEALEVHTYVTEAWIEAGLPSPSSCDIYIVTLDPDDFRKVTGFYDEDATPDCQLHHPGKCAIAYWIPYRNGDHLVALTESLSEEDIINAYLHEFTHQIASCSGLYPTGDNHEDPRLWGDSGILQEATRLYKIDHP